jgi:translation initiation factor IF-3
VQIVQNFRGREMMHRDRGDKRMKDIIEQMSDIAKVETPPRMAGRRMTMIFAPDKDKIRQIEQRDGSAKVVEGEAASEPPAEPTEPLEVKN